MKKKGIVILCAVLAVLIAGGGIGYSFLPHPLNYPINKIEPAGKAALNLIGETEDSVTLQKGDAAPLRILYFTDMHLDGKNATSKDTVGNMVKAIQKEQPDLVLLCGDNVTSGMNRARCRQLGKIFEQLGVYWGGTLDAKCEDKEGAYAAFQGYMELLRNAVASGNAAAERRYARLARHAMNMMLTYTMVWDATYPPGRLSDHAFKSTGWTVVSAQNQHLDAFGVLTTPEIWRMGEYLGDERLKRLAAVMYRSCFQLTDASGSLGEQIQQTNFAQQGEMSDVRKLRGGYSEKWTVFWLTAHFLNAAAQFTEMGILL